MKQNSDHWTKLWYDLFREAVRLRDTIVTQEEKKEQEKVLAGLDMRMESLCMATNLHLEQYQIERWKELIEDEKE